MRVLYTLIIACISITLFGQVDNISVGNSYSLSTYYDIETGDVTSFEHGVWDIAFNVSEGNGGVFVNESKALSMSAELPEVVLYSSSATDFENADTSMILERLYNGEISWDKGAFNSIANPDVLEDYGWGEIDPLTGEITGGSIYFIKLRDDSYRKITIESFIGSTYSFKYAHLDGSNEVSYTLDKNDYSGKTLAYYSIENGEEQDLEPAEWDLFFTRYYAGVDDGTEIVQYLVTGVLSNDGLPIVQADGIDPSEVDHNDFAGMYDEQIDIVGHDWKYFDLGAFQWVLPIDRVYFVETEQTIWQILFIDFSGSSSGITTLEKTNVLSSAVFDEANLETLGLSTTPNPSNGFFQIDILQTGYEHEALVQIYSADGKVVFNKNIEIQNGSHQMEIDIPLVTGNYFVVVRTNTQNIVEKIYILNN